MLGAEAILIRSRSSNGSLLHNGLQFGSTSTFDVANAVAKISADVLETASVLLFTVKALRPDVTITFPVGHELHFHSSSALEYQIHEQLLSPLCTHALRPSHKSAHCQQTVAFGDFHFTSRIRVGLTI
ncbi:Pantothenate synthetase [Trichinella pseudospiralis]